MNKMINNLSGLISKLSYAIDSVLEKLLFLNIKFKYKFGGFSSIPLPKVGSKHTMSDKHDEKTFHCFKRLNIILSKMPQDTKTIIDIGSNNGFYSIHLATKGYGVIGYESEFRFARAATLTAQKNKLSNVAFFNEAIDVQNSEVLFEADVSLVLSVFHNWVKQYDYNAAMKILVNIWKKTKKAMIFELANTVDNTYIASFPSMPSMGTTVEECDSFIQNSILGTLEGGEVELLGLIPTDFKNGTARHLYIITRK